MKKLYNWVKNIYSKLFGKKILRILLFSDTHTQHGKLIVPENIDMAIFAGDAGSYRNPVMNVNGVLDFIEWYSSLKNIKHKVWVAGNHDTSIENGLVDAKKLSVEKGLTYLQHESCVVNGIEIFGSPYTPSFGVGWAFNVSRNKIMNYWEEIPKTTEILVTHGGAKGLGNLNVVEEGEDVGCYYLKSFLETLPNLKIFVQGHIHEGYGIHQINNGALLVNASVLNRDYKLVNNPYIITFDVKNKKIINIEN